MTDHDMAGDRLYKETKRDKMNFKKSITEKAFPKVKSCFVEIRQGECTKFLPSDQKSCNKKKWFIWKSRPYNCADPTF